MTYQYHIIKIIMITFSIAFFFVMLLFGNTSYSETLHNSEWQQRLKDAAGKTIYFHAWGGSKTYNQYIAWVADTVQKRYNIKLNHVKIQNTADSLQKILSEKQAGKTKNGAIDMIWINGENFARMKQENLLWGKITHLLPNYNNYVDEIEKPAVIRDFDNPTNGLEAPWGLAQFVYIIDSNDMKAPPQNAMELLHYAKNNKGKITYPTPPDFTGVTFLKQIATEVLENPALLSSKPPKNYQKILKPLWLYLDELHLYAWRDGKNFPKNESEMIPLLNNREIDIAYSFNIAAAANAIANQQLPPTAKAYVPLSGTISNVHFLTIPFNSGQANAAKIVIDFMLSPEAQARKQNPKYWGEPTVLSLKSLPQNERKWFDSIPKNAAIPTIAELSKTLAEPHSGWVNILKDEWKKRYKN